VPRGLANVRRPLLALIVLVAALLIGYAVKAGQGDTDTPRAPVTTSSGQSTVNGLPVVPLYKLPPEADDTIRLIQDGGPFPYPRNDGVVFHNDENMLPHERDGYYHEYTVPTPGSDDRGARRIVTGTDGTFYYTGDHYDHFSVVVLGG